MYHVTPSSASAPFWKSKQRFSFWLMYMAGPLDDKNGPTLQEIATGTPSSLSCFKGAVLWMNGGGCSSVPDWLLSLDC